MHIRHITKNFLLFEDWQTGIFPETALCQLILSSIRKLHINLEISWGIAALGNQIYLTATNCSCYCWVRLYHAQQIQALVLETIYPYFTALWHFKQEIFLLSGLISSVQDCIPVITVFHVIRLSNIMCWSLYCKHKQSITKLLFINKVQSTKFKEISCQVQFYFWILNCWKYFSLEFLQLTLYFSGMLECVVG